MSTLTFTAHCAQGHDRIDFTDRLTFDEHMTGPAHRARKRLPGGPERPDKVRARWSSLGRSAPGWSRGAPEAPYEWAPPKPTVSRATLAALESGELALSYDQAEDDSAGSPGSFKSHVEDAYEALTAYPRCDRCGEPIDYCQGHGELG